MDVDFVHKESHKGKGKEKSKGKGKQNEKGKSSGKKQVEPRKVPRYMEKLWQEKTQVERMLGERRWSRETSEQCR